MSLETFLAILGILLTIVTWYLSFQYEKSKTKIFYFSKQLVQLYSDLTQNIPELAITYKGNAIRKKMFVSTGLFICSGKNDISESDIEKGIILTLLGSDPIWHSYKITQKSPDLDIQIITTEPAKLQIDFPLFKNFDYFVFEALGESERSDFNINHRINNVPNVIITTVGVEKTMRANAFAWLLAFLMFSSMFFFQLYNTTRLSSYNATFFNNNMKEIERTFAIDTLPPKPYSTPSWIVRKRSEPLDTSTPKEFSHSDRLRLQGSMVRLKMESLAFADSIDKVYQKEDAEFQAKYPTVIYAFDKVDSLLKIANSEYPYPKFSLLFKGKTKLYRLTPNYSIEFSINGSFSDFFLLIIIFFVSIISVALAIKYSNRYFRYKEVASIANKALS